MSERIRLATFKINGDRWAEFVNRAAAQNTSASALLKQFIDRYLAGIDLETIAPPSNVTSQITDALAPIRQEIQKLREKLERLTVSGHQESKPQGMNTRSSKDKPGAESSEGEGLGDRRLSRGEAHQLARSRGYCGAVTSLNRDLSDGKLEAFGVAIVEPHQRQVGNGARNYLELPLPL